MRGVGGPNHPMEVCQYVLAQRQKEKQLFFSKAVQFCLSFSAYITQLSNLWWMPNSVRKGFGPPMLLGSSRRLQKYPANHRWVSSRLLILNEPILKAGLNRFCQSLVFIVDWRVMLAYMHRVTFCEYLIGIVFSPLSVPFLENIFFWLLTVEENQSWILME